MKIIIFILISVAIIPEISHSQVTQQWLSTYNGSGNGTDIGNSIAVHYSGNVYVTGKSIGSGTGFDYATVKYNSTGIKLWESRYNGPGNGEDIAVAICVDNTENVYVTGTSKGSGSNNLDFATIKYNSSGVQQWVSRYNSGSLNDYVKALCIDSSGNVIVSGYNNSIQVVKYDSSGNQLWNSPYGISSSGYNVSEMLTDVNGNIFLTGSAMTDYITIKYNQAGSLIWNKSYNGPGNGSDFANAISIDSHANIFVTGGSYGGASAYDWATVKYDSTGNQLWAVRYGNDGEGNDVAYDLSVDSDGNICATGVNVMFIKEGPYIATIKYNTSGNQIWVNRIFGYSPNIGIKIANDVYNNSIVLCKSYVNFKLVKYGVSGQLLWTITYGGGSDVLSALAIDNSNNYYVTGYMTDSFSNINYVTIKYNDLITSVDPTLNIFPNAFLLFQNYPNPFNPTTIINYELQITNYVSLKIFDVLGNEVAALVNEKQNAGSYSIEFDGAKLPNGIYFYKLEAGNFTDTKRMILLK